MPDYIDPDLSASTVVQGVVQYNIGIPEKLHQYFVPEINDALSIKLPDLAKIWLDRTSKGLWGSPVSLIQKRYGRLLDKATATLGDIEGLDHSSILKTALTLKIVDEEEFQELTEMLEISRQEKFSVLQQSYNINRFFWGLHYADYHFHFLEAAILQNFVSQDQAAQISSAISSYDLGMITPKIIQSFFDKISGKPEIYPKISQFLNEKWVRLGNEFVNLHSEESIRISLLKLAGMDKYLAPGYESIMPEQQRWIGIAELKSQSNPSITVEALMGVSSYSIGLSQGNIIKTHSLFPGEKAVLTVENYSKEATTYSLTSSVLDTVSSQAENDFSSEINRSDSQSNENSQSNSYSFGIDAKASWGWGSAGGSTSQSGTAASTSKRAVSNAAKALRSQSAKVSNNRTVKVETTTTYQSERSERQSLVRTIENINVSRPLNFVFRQLAQNILSMITLRDVRIVISTAIGATPIVCSLEQLPDILVKKVFTNSISDKEIKTIYDDVVSSVRTLAYRDLGLNDPEKVNILVPTEDITEEPQPRYSVSIPAGRTFAKSRSAKIAMFAPQASKILSKAQYDILFDGVLLDLCSNSIRTEGIHVECYLSDNEGLDYYSKELQTETIREKSIENNVKVGFIDALETARSIVTQATTTEEKASLFERLVVPTLLAARKEEKNER